LGNREYIWRNYEVSPEVGEGIRDYIKTSFRMAGERMKDPVYAALAFGPGVIKEAFHGTRFGKFEKFRDTKDIGYHFGTLEQAKAKAYGKEGTIIKARLNIENPARLVRDFNQGDPFDLFKALPKEIADAATPEYWQFLSHLEDIGEQPSAAASNLTDQFEAIKTYLRLKGYDGIVYPNEVEGLGDSFIAFHPDQVEILEQRAFNRKVANEAGAVAPIMPKALTGIYEKAIARFPEEIRKKISVEAIKLGKFPAEHSGTGGKTIIGGKLSKPKYYIALEEGEEDLVEALTHELAHIYVLETPELAAKYPGYFGHEKAVEDVLKQIVRE